MQKNSAVEAYLERLNSQDALAPLDLSDLVWPPSFGRLDVGSVLELYRWAASVILWFTSLLAEPAGSGAGDAGRLIGDFLVHDESEPLGVSGQESDGLAGSILQTQAIAVAELDHEADLYVEEGLSRVAPALPAIVCVIGLAPLLPRACRSALYDGLLVGLDEFGPSSRQMLHSSMPIGARPGESEGSWWLASPVDSARLRSLVAHRLSDRLSYLTGAELRAWERALHETKVNHRATHLTDTGNDVVEAIVGAQVGASVVIGNLLATMNRTAARAHSAVAGACAIYTIGHAVLDDRC